MVNVVWFNGRGYWDQAILDIFWTPETNHLLKFDDLSSGEGAVVVIAARHVLERVDEINHALSALPWTLVLLTGDEESKFPVQNLSHPNMRVWVQTPRPELSSVYRALPNGPTPNIPARPSEKPLDWAFMGQVTHVRRQTCYNALCNLRNGLLVGSVGFTQGLPHDQYLKTLGFAKIIACPSGPCTPDSFRVYEALELGCVPIVDTRTVSDTYPRGYWERLFGRPFPFPQISDWNLVEDVIKDELSKWPNNAVECSRWWEEQKAIMKKKFEEDLWTLKSKC